MKNFWEFLNEIWNEKIVALWTPIKLLLPKLVLVLIICFLYKYTFLTNCISVINIQSCVSTTINDSNTVITIGGLLLALFVLIPTFWIESRVKEAKKEVTEELKANIHLDMNKINEAQMLLIEAYSYYNIPDSFSDAEQIVKKAIEIWPDFKQKEFMRLGINMSIAVIHGYFPVKQGSTPYNQLRQDEIAWLSRSAITYLKETNLNIDKPDKEGLLYLACMYGYQKKYGEMMKIIDIGMKVDVLFFKEEFQEPRKLSNLLAACEADRTKLEKLGKKLGLVLPASKDTFCNSLKNIDLVGRNPYIQWILVKRPLSEDEGAIYIINISIKEDISGKKVYAAYSKSGDNTIFSKIGDEKNCMSIEELFDQINQSFFFISMAEY